jgi:pimeloyl-ACP methyl ester carboxylesterase
MSKHVTSGARILQPNVVRTADGVDLFYRDWGAGKPVLFVAGWSLGADSWCYQMMALREQGLRVIAFDRRGHGRSSDPGRGYDFDTLSDDIAAVLEALDLRQVTLVGHSIGCNEIVRYLARHGSARVTAVALLGTMTPYVLQDDDNPHGIDGRLLEHFRNAQLKKDLPQWIADNIDPFLTPDTPQPMRDWLSAMPYQASLQALHDCNLALQHADMRDEMRRIEVPVLLIAGTADVSAPFELTAVPSAALLPRVQMHVYQQAPHGMFITHMERVNGDLLAFIAQH